MKEREDKRMKYTCPYCNNFKAYPARGYTVKDQLWRHIEVYHPVCMAVAGYHRRTGMRDGDRLVAEQRGKILMKAPLVAWRLDRPWPKIPIRKN